MQWPRDFMRCQDVRPARRVCSRLCARLALTTIRHPVHWRNCRWPGILLVYPLVGRLWCSFCPFMAYGELVQRWRLATGARLRRWPSDALDRYGAWFLYALFAAILVWEEVCALEDHARLSSALLLLITAGAVAGSAMFEKRVWCRYLCPIGACVGAHVALSAPPFMSLIAMLCRRYERPLRQAGGHRCARGARHLQRNVHHLRLLQGLAARSVAQSLAG